MKKYSNHLLLIINLIFVFTLSACGNPVENNGGGGTPGSVDMVGSYSYTITDSSCSITDQESGTITWSFNSTTEVYTVTMTSDTGLDVSDCSTDTEIDASITFSDADPIEQGEVGDRFFDLLTERGFVTPSGSSQQTQNEEYVNDLLENATFTRVTDDNSTVTMIVTR